MSGRKQQKTKTWEAAAEAILQQGHPMTVRQVYYQMVVSGAVPNSKTGYNHAKNAILSVRKQARVPWEWIEDPSRRPRTVIAWSGLKEFMADAALAYRKDIWPTQPVYIEVWVEKEALAGIFESVCRPYGVTVNVGHGFNSWTAVQNAALRFNAASKPGTVLYFGDHDASGKSISASLEKILRWFDCHAQVVVGGILKADIRRYHLQPDLTKMSDTRAESFIAKHGDATVELDALPVDVLKARLQHMIESRLDIPALGKVKRQEKLESKRLRQMLGNK